MTATGRRYLLDQNFPVNLVRVMSEFMPDDLALFHLPAIDERLSDARDRELIIWAKKQGYDALVSTNYRMLDQPDEVAAMVETKLTMVLTKKMGHNPLRASGALFLELPTLHHRVRPGKSNIFLLTHEPRKPAQAWEHLTKIAARRATSTESLWQQFRPTDQEMRSDLLG
jgi:hypothetical protein